MAELRFAEMQAFVAANPPSKIRHAIFLSYAFQAMHCFIAAFMLWMLLADLYAWWSLFFIVAACFSSAGGFITAARWRYYSRETLRNILKLQQMLAEWERLERKHGTRP